MSRPPLSLSLLRFVSTPSLLCNHSRLNPAYIIQEQYCSSLWADHLPPSSWGDTMRYDISFEFLAAPAPLLQEINKYFIRRREGVEIKMRAHTGAAWTHTTKSNKSAFTHSCSHSGLCHHMQHKTVSQFRRSELYHETCRQRSFLTAKNEDKLKEWWRTKLCIHGRRGPGHGDPSICHQVYFVVQSWIFLFVFFYATSLICLSVCLTPGRIAAWGSK